MKHQADIYVGFQSASTHFILQLYSILAFNPGQSSRLVKRPLHKVERDPEHWNCLKNRPCLIRDYLPHLHSIMPALSSNGRECTVAGGPQHSAWLQSCLLSFTLKECCWHKTTSILIRKHSPVCGSLLRQGCGSAWAGRSSSTRRPA